MVVINGNIDAEQIFTSPEVRNSIAKWIKPTDDLIELVYVETEAEIPSNFGIYRCPYGNFYVLNRCGKIVIVSSGTDNDIKLGITAVSYVISMLRPSSHPIPASLIAEDIGNAVSKNLHNKGV